MLLKSKVQIEGPETTIGAGDGLIVGWIDGFKVGVGVSAVAEGCGETKGVGDGVLMGEGNTSVFLTCGLKIKNDPKIKLIKIINKTFDFILHCSRIRVTMASWEERKNLRSAVTMIVLSIAVIIFLFFVGIPLVAKFAGFLSDLRSTQADANDKTPPAPPRFTNTVDFINQKNINLNGNAESGSTIKLIFNGVEKENITDKNGNFTFNLDLSSNENSFSAVAVDPSGNVSQKTKEYKVIFDDKTPTLEITKPTDGSNIFGSAQRQITIEGTTEDKVQLTINDRYVSVEDNGGFSYSTTLSEGENKFKIKAVDLATNTIEKELVLNFTP